MIEAHMADPFHYNYKLSPKSKVIHRLPTNDLLSAYIESIESSMEINDFEVSSFYQSISNKIEPAKRITSDVIDSFAHSTQSYESSELYSLITGLWVSNLMQRACNQGCKNLYLDFRDLKPLDYVGYGLWSKNDKIKIMIEGSVGDSLGDGSWNTIFYCREGSLLFSPRIVNATYYLGQTHTFSGKSFECLRIRILNRNQSCYQMLSLEFEAAWNHAKRIIVGEKP